MRVSHGCVRMYPEDIAALFPMVPVGTEVRIVNQPYLLGWSDRALELEIHKPLEEDASLQGLTYLNELVTQWAAAGGDPLDEARIATLAAEARGIPVPVNVGTPSLRSIIRDAPVVRNDPADPVQVAHRN